MREDCPLKLPFALELPFPLEIPFPFELAFPLVLAFPFELEPFLFKKPGDGAFKSVFSVSSVLFIAEPFEVLKAVQPGLVAVYDVEQCDV